MALDLDDVRRVSQLARLRLDDAQTHALLGELNAIFGMIAEMEAVDTADVVPMSHPRDVSQRPAAPPRRSPKATPVNAPSSDPPPAPPIALASYEQ